jgi:hypothetical protein
MLLNGYEDGTSKKNAPFHLNESIETIYFIPRNQI